MRNKYASDNNLIGSEEELSQRFDQNIIPGLREQWLQYSDEPDYPMISETFSNWTDGLVSDGELHKAQLDEYCYVGKYKED